MYEDCEMRLLPGDDHNPPIVIPISEDVVFEPVAGGSRLVKVTVPPGRAWFMLPADLLSRKVGGEL
jgi:hypothetical protein